MPNQTTEILNKIRPFQSKLLAENYSIKEYKELLLITGISEREYNILQNSLGDYLTRADGFLKHKLYPEALSEYNTSRLINPLDIRVNIGLANTYLALFLKNKKDELKNSVEYFANFCLKLDAGNKEALKILSDLKQNTTNNNFSLYVNNKGNKKTTTIIATSILTLIFLFTFSVIWLDWTNIEKKDFNQTSVSEVIVTEKKEKVINVELENDDYSKLLNLDIRTSIVRETGSQGKNSYNYKFNGFVSSKKPLKNLLLNLKGIDKDGNILFTGKIYTRLSQLGSRPNDKLPISTIKYIKEATTELDKIIISALQLEEGKSISNYPALKAIKTVKKFPETDPKTDIKLLERASDIGYNQYSKAVLHSITLELENTGKTVINKIYARSKWYSKNGSLIKSHDWHLYYDQTPLKPGDKIPIYTVLNLNKERADVDYYEIEITEIETELN
jgi:hypothetical protein